MNISLNRNEAFTIIELLIVIAIIGILAAITLVSYTGVSSRATTASLQSDLSSAATLLKLFQTTDVNDYYPATINCAIPDSSTNKCIKSSSGNTYTYTPNNSTNPRTFSLDATNGSTTYNITSSTTPVLVTDWITIGSKTWAKANINVGTMIAVSSGQANNSILEKYCYNGLESNCTTYGGLYQWDEAMQYVTTVGAQGICPVGSHIPSDNDWKILEVSLGMTQGQADSLGWRGSDQGTQLKPSGSSGLNIALAGYRTTDWTFGNFGSYGELWSSSESTSFAYYRELGSGAANVNRDVWPKARGLSIRCLKN